MSQRTDFHNLRNLHYMTVLCLYMMMLNKKGKVIYVYIMSIHGNGQQTVGPYGLSKLSLRYAPDKIQTLNSWTHQTKLFLKEQAMHCNGLT